MISVFIRIGPLHKHRRRLNRENSSITLRCAVVCFILFPKCYILVHFSYNPWRPLFVTTARLGAGPDPPLITPSGLRKFRLKNSLAWTSRLMSKHLLFEKLRVWKLHVELDKSRSTIPNMGSSEKTIYRSHDRAKFWTKNRSKGLNTGVFNE